MSVITSKYNLLLVGKLTVMSFLLLLTGMLPIMAQDEPVEIAVPPYQTMYDDPYDIRNLYLNFQPLYGDISALNLTGGFGIEGTYYHKSLFDAQLAFRTSYGKRFDLNRYAATKNDPYGNNYPLHFNLEFGGTYHIQDIMKESTSKVLLYSKQLKGTEWASTVARSAEISGRLRTVIGGRLGGMFYSSTLNVSSALEAQNKELTYEDGTPVLEKDMYSNVNTFVVYIGGSYSMIRNYAVEFSERWDPSGDDMLFTPYFDLMFAPSIKINDLTLASGPVSAAPVDKLSLGFRGGMNIKFNRQLSWGATVETGFRPGIKKRGFFVLFKMSFPIYAKKIEYKDSGEDNSGN